MGYLNACNTSLVLMVGSYNIDGDTGRGGGIGIYVFVSFNRKCYLYYLFQLFFHACQLMCFIMIAATPLSPFHM